MLPCKNVQQKNSSLFESFLSSVVIAKNALKYMITSISSSIFEMHISQLRRERKWINPLAIPVKIQPYKELQYYTPVWLSTGQVIKLDIPIQREKTSGPFWGMYQGLEWGISEYLPNSYIVFHSVIPMHNKKDGPYYWLTERILATDVQR